jgi:sulfonate transport system substrate-binding protein
LKIEEDVLEKVARRRTYRLRKLTPAIIAEQQRVADFYFEEKVIPKKIDIKETILPTKLTEAITPKRIK